MAHAGELEDLVVRDVVVAARPVADVVAHDRLVHAALADEVGGSRANVSRAFARLNAPACCAAAAA